VQGASARPPTAFGGPLRLKLAEVAHRANIVLPAGAYLGSLDRVRHDDAQVRRRDEVIRHGILHNVDGEDTP
jgi:hypothetical protein